MKKINLEHLLKLIAEALDIPDDQLTIDSSSENISEWDSLGHLSILSTLDKIISGEIAEISELGEAESVRSIKAILEANGYLE